MTQPTANLAARINAVPVTAEDLLRAAAAIHQLPPDKRDWHARAMCAVHLFKHAATDKAYAVTARLEAMADLVASGRVPDGFVPRMPNGSRMIADPVFKAAACEPLLSEDARCYFDAESFVAAIFRHADLEDEG